MLQKIIKVGNSAAITIPKEFLEKAKLSIGEEMFVETDPIRKIILAKSKDQKDKMSLSPEFFSWLENISRKYEDTIKELARK